MLPTINGKSLLECSEGDFEDIIDNPDYRENEYIDYKSNFSILEYSKEQKTERKQAIAEFRSDVCSFANANGGYLIYGISEDGTAIPNKIVGVSIKNQNRDHFELNVRDWLQFIQPRIPNFTIKFIDLKNGKYIVILFVQHDYFAPYVHLENEKDYRIYKRIGNRKTVITYTELKKMFTQSLSLEKEIEIFRKERIKFFQPQESGTNNRYEEFLLVHLIPETFLDSNYNKDVYVMERNGKKFSFIFQSFGCDLRSFPMVEGLKSLGFQEKSEGRFYNNGIAEVFFPLVKYLHFDDRHFRNGALPWKFIWEKIESAVTIYIKKINNCIYAKKIYACISIIGCKDVITEFSQGADSISSIDRSVLMCQPVVFEDITNEGIVERDLKRFQLDFMFSLGIKIDKEINQLIKEVYDK